MHLFLFYLETFISALYDYYFISALYDYYFISALYDYYFISALYDYYMAYDKQAKRGGEGGTNHLRFTVIVIETTIAFC